MFIQTCALEIGDNAGEWITGGLIIYRSSLLAELIVVPVGFATDLASVPWAVQFAFPINGRHRLAAVLHDYLYRQAGCVVTRKQADLIFKEAMLISGEAPWRARAMYRGVRMGGWLHYKSCASSVV